MNTDLSSSYKFLTPVILSEDALAGPCAPVLGAL